MRTRRFRDPEEMIARATDVMERFPLLAPLAKGIRDGQTGRDAARRRAERRARHIARQARRMALFVAGVVFLTLFYGIGIGPIGVGALMLIVLATIAGLIGIGVWGAEDLPQPAKLATARPAVLPAQVDAWLDTKRRALPALAAPRIDAISAQLAALGPQLAAVPAGDPTALELNRLLGKHLPELVDRYEKVAPAQRKTAAPGAPTIERQLVDGLGLIEAELVRVNDQLGKDDRDAFAVQGKFLETRYGKDGTLAP